MKEVTLSVKTFGFSQRNHGEPSPSFESDQLQFLVPKHAQCSEIYSKTIFRFYLFRSTPYVSGHYATFGIKTHFSGEEGPTCCSLGHGQNVKPHLILCCFTCVIYRILSIVSNYESLIAAVDCLPLLDCTACEPDYEIHLYYYRVNDANEVMYRSF